MTKISTVLVGLSLLMAGSLLYTADKSAQDCMRNVTNMHDENRRDRQEITAARKEMDALVDALRAAYEHGDVQQLSSLLKHFPEARQLYSQRENSAQARIDQRVKAVAQAVEQLTNPQQPKATTTVSPSMAPKLVVGLVIACGLGYIIIKNYKKLIRR